MKYRYAYSFVSLVIVTFFVVAGCGADGEHDSSEENTDQISGVSNNGDVHTDESENEDNGNTTDGPSPEEPVDVPDTPDTPEIPGPVSTCEEANATACFANHECQNDQRCQNIGADDDFVSCCVNAPRGTKEAGEPCDEESGEMECASSICISGNSGALCSKTCSSNEDCPQGMKNCTYIAFSGSDDQWCLPEQ